MLAYPFSLKRLESWEKFYIQPKLDGVRAEAHVNPDKGQVRIFSSTGREINSVPHLNSTLALILRRENRHLILDGELYSEHLSHQKINSIVSRTQNLHPDAILIDFQCFDLVDDRTQEERIRDLTEIYERFKETKGQQPGAEENPNFFTMVPTFVSSETKDIDLFLPTFLSMGYEGIILREASGLYERKRSTSLMKSKPRKTDEYEIIGFHEELSKDGTPKDTLGALVLRDQDQRTFSVGSGSFLTQRNRDDLWDQRHELLGRTAVVKYQELTDRGVPRFPVLIALKDA
jgi:DNA ligase-1